MRLIVPWKVNPRERDQLTPIKFHTNDGESFKLYEYTLDSFDLGDILQHVVSFEQKICQAVTDQEQRQRCFGKVFGRTLARPLQATWETFTTQFGTPINEAGFVALVKGMISSFATEDNRRDLLNQLRDAQKPRDVTVQVSHHRNQQHGRLSTRSRPQVNGKSTAQGIPRRYASALARSLS